MHVGVHRDAIQILQTLRLRELCYPRGIGPGNCTANDARLRICRLDTLISRAQQVDVLPRVTDLGSRLRARAMVPLVPDLEILHAALEVLDRKRGISCEGVYALWRGNQPAPVVCLVPVRQDQHRAVLTSR